MTSNAFSLDGKVALITGAGSGFGRTFAVEMAMAGADIVCVDKDSIENAKTRDLVLASGKRCWALDADVTNAGSVAMLSDSALALAGKIDVLVNNAGIATAPVRTHDLSEDDWDRLLAVNLKGVFLCSRAIFRFMLSAGSGSVINITSLLGLRGYFPGVPSTTSNYAAAKAGVIGLTKQMAAEYAGDGIRVNAVAPGWHSGTNLGRANRASATEEQRQRFEERLVGRTPMRRRGRPEELASLIIYLASDASSFVTGQVFTHDGGWSAV